VCLQGAPAAEPGPPGASQRTPHVPREGQPALDGHVAAAAADPHTVYVCDLRPALLCALGVCVCVCVFSLNKTNNQIKSVAFMVLGGVSVRD